MTQDGRAVLDAVRRAGYELIKDGVMRQGNPCHDKPPACLPGGILGWIESVLLETVPSWLQTCPMVRPIKSPVPYCHAGPEMPELPEVETIKNQLRVPVKIDIKLGKNWAEMG